MSNYSSVQTYSQKCKDVTLFARCPLYFEVEVMELLKVVCKLVEQGKVLAPGTTIQIGWSILTLREYQNGLLLCEPSFSTNPFTDRPFSEVTRTLLVLSMQKDFLAQLNFSFKEEITLFYKKILIRKNSLINEQISVERSEPAFPDDSGWVIGLPGGAYSPGNKEDFEFIYIYELVQLRLHVLAVLNLPVGYLVGFDGDEVQIVFDGSQQIIWQKSN